MKNIFWVFFSLILIGVFVGGCTLSSKQIQPTSSAAKPPINSMIKITSPAFSNNGNLPKKYSCDGEGVNPGLAIEGVPDKAKSLVLILDDPDAPVGTFNHWLVWNIDPKTTEIKENNLSDGGVVGTNSGGKANYFPPCPPFGTHRYIFKIYALDTVLNLPASAKKSELEKAMENYILDKGEILAKYSR